MKYLTKKLFTVGFGWSLVIGLCLCFSNIDLGNYGLGVIYGICSCVSFYFFIHSMRRKYE